MLVTSYRPPLIVALCLTAAIGVATRPRSTPTVTMPAPSSDELEATALPSLREVASQPAVPPGANCPRAVSKIGIAASGKLPDVDEPLRGASVDPESCLVAAWSEQTLYVSWDGGESFAAFDTKSELRQLETSGDRVVAVADDEVGVMHRGDATITWRSLAQFTQNVAAGTIVPVSIGDRYLAVSSNNGFAVSDDDGATWRTLAAPASNDRWDAGELAGVDADGSIISRQFASTAWQAAHPVTDTYEGDDEPHVIDGYDRWLATKVEDGAWHELAAVPDLWTDGESRPIASGWSYTFERDRFWGCGGSVKLVASNASRQVTLVGDQRPDVWEVRVVRGDRAAFVQYHDDEQRLAQLVGTKLVPIAVPYDWWVRLVAVDRYDTPIALVDGHLMRWSRSGGWRVLL